MNPKTEPVVLPRHLLELFFQKKPIRFAVLGLWPPEEPRYQTGLLEVAVSPDEVPYIRVCGSKCAPSSSTVWHSIVSRKMLERIQWDANAGSFVADWFQTDVG